MKLTMNELINKRTILRYGFLRDEIEPVRMTVGIIPNNFKPVDNNTPINGYPFRIKKMSKKIAIKSR